MTAGAVAEILAAQAQERAAAKAAVDAFVRALANADPEALVASIEALEMTFSWRAAFRKVTRLGEVDDDVRHGFMRFWMACGDTIRSSVSDDLVLLDGLRVLLPTYTGPEITLYRGELAWNRRCRTYGLSWSASREVGEDYALRSFRRSAKGGTVLLRTAAPAAAIICAPHALGHDRYAEQEYIVDRRRLRSVEAASRYPQMSLRGGEPRQPRLRPS